MPQRITTDDVFDLPERLRAKADPALIAGDRARFAAIAAALTGEVDRASTRLEALRREPAASGHRALERDLEIRALSARVRVLQRFGLDACIGRMVGADGSVRYIGRFGLSAAGEEPLLMDWRAPASAPFFAASGADPMGLANRRRYRWRNGRIVDYWDEVYAPDGVDHSAALDDQSAFIASLGAARAPKMRDVLATIQSDQDDIIRSSSHGALVVDGGPGTGKTVVALHRAAYLLYADARLQHGSGGLLFVGPHRPYVDYVDDVLPSLGEDGALVCAVDDLVRLQGDALVEPDSAVRRLKGDGRMVDAVEAAVRLWQRAPTRAQYVDTAWGTVPISPADWADVFAEADVTSHNALRSRAWERLLALLEERIEDDGEEGRDPWAEQDSFDAFGDGWDDDESVRDALENDADLRDMFDRAWPLLDPDALVRGLLGSSSMLRRCAPWLSDDDIDLLTAACAGSLAPGGERAWTDVDLPLLDTARLLVGDPRVEMGTRRARREAAAEKRMMSDVVTDLIAADDGDLRIMSMLRGQDLRLTLTETAASDLDPYAGPFAHVIVDEAQELTDAQWRMLLRRCPSGSLTIVGDRAQARHGFTESWADRLTRVGVGRATVATLTVNYRTPEEVMDAAATVIRSVLPDANVPTSIRPSGIPVRYGHRDELADIVAAWEQENSDGTAVVVGAASFPRRERVLALDPVSTKGLEFDLVVLMDPDRWGAGLTGTVDRYVAMTRATQRLVVLTG
ncbi:RNA polymerase recycling motor ATPase HelR [Microbacterium sp. CIAB417]|uniref:RNA polymerase recycling motor ATPase HelR n=1 Tax=Microbacterium sp. CIAB417 TaxID=2860287 RepID=UPI001FACE972|nr:RNA polymerase recycling motor ATPase HelR [Microbacterium sp. CIAB417]